MLATTPPAPNLLKIPILLIDGGNTRSSPQCSSEFLATDSEPCNSHYQMTEQTISVSRLYSRWAGMGYLPPSRLLKNRHYSAPG